MTTLWMDGEFVLASYLTCLALLFWLRAAFACFVLLASVLLFCFEWTPNTVSARLSTKSQWDCGTSHGQVRPCS
jgi:hypothetical protein